MGRRKLSPSEQEEDFRTHFMDDVVDVDQLAEESLCMLREETPEQEQWRGRSGQDTVVVAHTCC